MLEEDQAGFRIPMSLGEPHAELDASQCLEKTQESTPHPYPHGPFFPRTKDSSALDYPPSEPRNLFSCTPNPLSDPFPQGISLTSWVSTTSLGSPGSTHLARLVLLPASPQERVGLGRYSLADLTLVLGQLSLTPVFSCTLFPCLYVTALSNLFSVEFLSLYPCFFNSHTSPEASWDDALASALGSRHLSKPRICP